MVKSTRNLWGLRFLVLWDAVDACIIQLLRIGFASCFSLVSFLFAYGALNNIFFKMLGDLFVNFIRALLPTSIAWCVLLSPFIVSSYAIGHAISHGFFGNICAPNVISLVAMWGLPVMMGALLSIMGMSVITSALVAALFSAISTAHMLVVEALHSGHLLKWLIFFIDPTKREQLEKLEKQPEQEILSTDLRSPPALTPAYDTSRVRACDVPNKSSSLIPRKQLSNNL